jgi:hypothetical protein
LLFWTCARACSRFRGWHSLARRARDGDARGGDDGDQGRTIARRAFVAASCADDGADGADAARRARRERRRWGAHRVIGIGGIERVVGGDAVGVGSHDGDDECASRWVRC